MQRFEVHERVTLAGSTIPASIMFTHSPVAALKPMPTSSRFQALNDDGTFKTSVVSDLTNWLFKSTKNDVNTCCYIASYSFSTFATAPYTFTSAVPPPDTIPSSTAARVAFNASSIRSLRSFNSVSVAAPTLITATPPAKFS